MGFFNEEILRQISGQQGVPGQDFNSFVQQQVAPPDINQMVSNEIGAVPVGSFLGQAPQGRQSLPPLNASSFFGAPQQNRGGFFGGGQFDRRLSDSPFDGFDQRGGDLIGRIKELFSQGGSSGFPGFSPSAGIGGGNLPVNISTGSGSL